MSRFGAVESSGFAVLSDVSALQERRLVAAGVLLQYKPSVYPAAVVAMLNPTAMKPGMAPSPGHVSHRYRCELGIVIYASSDGMEIGDARGSAWTLTDAVIDAFSAPPWIPLVPGATPWPAEVGSPINVITDTGVNAIYLPVTVEIEWRT